jgi:hypothetical protein
VERAFLRDTAGRRQKKVRIGNVSYAITPCEGGETAFARAFSKSGPCESEFSCTALSNTTLPFPPVDHLIDEATTLAVP